MTPAAHGHYLPLHRAGRFVLPFPRSARIPSALSSSKRNALKETDMHTLTFNDNEKTLLIEILEAYVATLPHEIHKTDHREYRDMLEEKQGKLQQMLKRLQES
jgi:hypothetical protein